MGNSTPDHWAERAISSIELLMENNNKTWMNLGQNLNDLLSFVKMWGHARLVASQKQLGPEAERDHRHSGWARVGALRPA